MMLAIMKNSFHYKYYLMLRKMWDMSELYNKNISLCTYSQFIFWMTLLTAIFSPLILAGWLELKFFRFVYKVCSWTKVGRFFTDLLDDKLGLGEDIETVSNRMLDAPASVLIKLALAVLMGSLVILIMVTGVSLGVGILIYYFMNIPEYVIGFLHCLSLGLFCICCLIGFGICCLISCIGTCLTYIGLILSAYAGFLVLLFCLIMTVSVIVIILTKVMLSIESIRNFFGFKINGFHKARKSAKERKEELEDIKLKLYEEKMLLKRKKESGEIPPTAFEKSLSAFHRKMCGFFQRFKEKSFEKTAKVKGGTVIVIGGIGLVWQTIKSIKNGVCPFVEFIDEEDFEDNSPKG